MTTPGTLYLLPNTLGKTKPAVKLTRTVEVLSVYGEMKTRPETNVRIGFKDNIGRLDRSLQLVIFGRTAR